MCPYHLLNQGYALEAKPFPSANVADKGALMKRDPLEPMTRIQPMTTQSVPPLAPTPVAPPPPKLVRVDYLDRNALIAVGNLLRAIPCNLCSEYYSTPPIIDVAKDWQLAKYWPHYKVAHSDLVRFTKQQQQVLADMGIDLPLSSSYEVLRPSYHNSAPPIPWTVVAYVFMVATTGALLAGMLVNARARGPGQPPAASPPQAVVANAPAQEPPPAAPVVAKSPALQVDFMGTLTLNRGTAPPQLAPASELLPAPRLHLFNRWAIKRMWKHERGQSIDDGPDIVNVQPPVELRFFEGKAGPMLYLWEKGGDPDRETTMPVRLGREWGVNYVEADLNGSAQRWDWRVDKKDKLTLVQRAGEGFTAIWLEPVE